MPPTITALRAFLGFTNYYSAYVRNYADLAAPLMEKLKVGREAGRAGSKHPIVWSESEKPAFETLKKALADGLELQTVDPDRPFILRVDASGRGVGQPWSNS